MVDLKNDIIDLLEKSLHSFITERTKEVFGDNTAWRSKLKSFVIEQYEHGKSSISYQMAYNYYINNQTDTLDFDVLDVTALTALLSFYKDFEILAGADRQNQKHFKNYYSLYQISRNNMTHRIEDTSELSDDIIKELYINQINALSTIIGFSTLCERMFPYDDTWKAYYQRAVSLLKKTEGEKWLFPSTTKSEAIPLNENLSDLLNQATGGDAVAQEKIGEAFCLGERVDRDYDKSFYWLKKAARAGSAKAKYYLGFYYETGVAVDMNREAAYKYYREAAEAGIPKAQMIMSMHINGEDIDFEEHIRWIKLAAAQDYPEAVLMLSQYYRSGVNVNKDIKKADELLLHYAKLTGENYYSLQGKEALERNEWDKAIDYFMKAKETGYTDAEKNIKRARRAKEREDRKK